MTTAPVFETGAEAATGFHGFRRMARTRIFIVILKLKINFSEIPHLANYADHLGVTSELYQGVVININSYFREPEVFRSQDVGHPEKPSTANFSD